MQLRFALTLAILVGVLTLAARGQDLPPAAGDGSSVLEKVEALMKARGESAKAESELSAHEASVGHLFQADAAEQNRWFDRSRTLLGNAFRAWVRLCLADVALEFEGDETRCHSGPLDPAIHNLQLQFLDSLQAALQAPAPSPAPRLFSAPFPVGGTSAREPNPPRMIESPRLPIPRPVQPLAVVSPNPIVPGVLGEPYRYQLQASGGDGQYDWIVNKKPAWARVSGQGIIDGVPDIAGPHEFIVRLTDNSGHSTSPMTLRLNVIQALEITTKSLPSGVTGVAYEFALQAIGKGVRWKASGPLPAGMKLAENGVLSGTPREPGVFLFTISARIEGPAAVSDRVSFKLTIQPRQR